MDVIHKPSSVFCLIILSTLCLTPAASAQSSRALDTSKTYPLREVIVIGTRGSGETLSLPMAVGVVDLKEISPSRRLALNDALWLMPGVFVQNRAGGQDVRLTIRGFGARGNGDRSNAATIRGIKVLLDGIPETEPDGRTALDLIDLNAVGRIEVLRSNASTLFGNASGGVIQLETGSLFEGPFVETKNIIGSFGLRKNNITLGSSVGSTRLFLSASNADFDGWRKNSRNSSTQFHLAITSIVGATTKLRVLASGASNTFYIPGALTQTQFDSDPTQANPLYLARKERRANKTGRLAFDLSTTLASKHTLDFLGFIAPKVLERSERGTYRDFNRYHVGGAIVYAWENDEGRFLHRLTAGVDEAYQDGSILFYNLIDGERGDSLRTNKREGAETNGLFLQTELRLSGRVYMTLGLRYDRQRYIAEDFAAGAKQKSAPDQLDLDHLAPKAALLYRFTENHSLYFNVSGGLEAPAFNEVDPPPTLRNAKLNPFLAPMISTTFEAGAKGFVQSDTGQFVRSLSYSAALYRIGIKNEIVPYNGGAYYFSAGKSRRVGFELGGEATFQRGLAVTAAFTYLDAIYETYANDLGDFSQHKVPGIPQTVFKTRLRYTFDLGTTVEIALENVGEYFADDANTLTVPSSTIFNASISHHFRVGRFNVNGFFGVGNLFEGIYASSAFINPTGGAFLEPGLPRNFFGGIDVRTDF